jgi:predicted transcriptional regulator
LAKKQTSTRVASKKPTDAELAILGVIWDLGSATVREVHEVLNAQAETGQTTVLKHMQIMVEKGLLTKDAGVRPQVFSAAIPREKTQKQLLGHVLDGAFSGSPGNLVLQALSMRETSPEELAKIRKMLDELEGGAS